MTFINYAQTVSYFSTTVGQYGWMPQTMEGTAWTVGLTMLLSPVNHIYMQNSLTLMQPTVKTLQHTTWWCSPHEDIVK